MKRSESQSLISSINHTKCMIASLCIWFICVIIFVSRNRDEISHPNINFAHPFTINNIPKDQQVSSINTEPPLSYTHSISSELSSNGWDPIYIHARSTRMSVEQMDYLLDTYWSPHINNNKHETVETADNLNTKQRVLKQKENDHNKHHEKLRQAPSTSKPSDIKYPPQWSSPCYPTQLHSTKCINSQMKYWQKGIAVEQNSNNFKKASLKAQYVTFLKDCGGFNNIRQSFEYHAMIAWLTDRTLVLPPDMPWYLIDFGQITRGRSDKKAVDLYPAWPDNKAHRYGASNYDIWFDLDDMSLVIPIITTAQFIRKEFESLQIPMEFAGGDIVNLDGEKARSYQRWLTEKATALNANAPWGQLANVLYWPSIKAVERKNSAQIDDIWVDNRKKREYTAFLKVAKFIHFPSCAKGVPGEDHEYRYLGQIARSVAFDNVEQDVRFKRVLRDHVHLKGEIMEYAALVVSILGAFNFASFHIRRNELQYRYVFAKATESYRNVRPLIGENEVLYIATDETVEDYFKVFEENGRRKVYRWKHFFGADAVFEETKNVAIPPKFHGEVEMAICAMGRIFFGTKESTFSSYIGRLRGYVGAPFTQTLYHHYALTKDVDESSRISKSNPGKPYAGQIYKIPFPELWQID